MAETIGEIPSREQLELEWRTLARTPSHVPVNRPAVASHPRLRGCKAALELNAAPGRSTCPGLDKFFENCSTGALYEPQALAAPMHRHRREDDYHFVLEGNIGALLDDAVAIASPGDLIFKPRDQSHTSWNAGAAPGFSRPAEVTP